MGNKQFVSMSSAQTQPKKVAEEQEDPSEYEYYTEKTGEEGEGAVDEDIETDEYDEEYDEEDDDQPAEKINYVNVGPIDMKH